VFLVQNVDFFPSLLICVWRKSFTAVSTVYTLQSSLSDVPCKFDAAYFAVTIYKYQLFRSSDIFF
jgi:hypothetical protein